MINNLNLSNIEGYQITEGGKYMNFELVQILITNNAEKLRIRLEELFNANTVYIQRIKLFNANTVYIQRIKR